MSTQRCDHYDSASFNNGEKSGTVCLECGRIEIQAVKLPAPYPDHIYLAAQRSIENRGSGYDVLHKVWDAATVNNYDDLRNLPLGVVIITAEPFDDGPITTIYERTGEETWLTGDYVASTNEIHLPATVLYWAD